MQLKMMKEEDTLYWIYQMKKKEIQNTGTMYIRA